MNYLLFFCVFLAFLVKFVQDFGVRKSLLVSMSNAVNSVSGSMPGNRRGAVSILGFMEPL